MTEHTHGPWTVGYQAMDIWATDAKGPFKLCDIRAWGHLTGKGHGALGLPPDEAVAIQTANACLIAAAPDMLNALKAALPILRTGAGIPSARERLELVEAAIAKATGQP